MDREVDGQRDSGEEGQRGRETERQRDREGGQEWLPQREQALPTVLAHQREREAS